MLLPSATRLLSSALGAALAAALLVPSLTATAQSNVPIDDPRPTADIERELKGGDGWLGVALTKVDKAKATKLGYHRDLVGVENVFSGSPAQSSGFETGDVILKLDTQDIKSIKQLVEKIRGAVPGTKVQFVLLRDGKKLEVPLLLGVRPNQYSLLKSAFVDRPAPPFKVRKTEGHGDTKLSDYRGKVLVVDFWATWCGPCRASIPHLNSLSKKYDPAEFAVLGITDDGAKAVARFRAKTGVAYPTASDTKRTANKAYLVNALPTVFVIDHKGIVREVIIGGGQNKARQLDDTIARLVAKRRADLEPSKR